MCLNLEAECRQSKFNQGIILLGEEWQRVLW